MKKNLIHFTFFYNHLRYRIFITLGLSLLVGVLDGFGLAMFLPLLHIVDGNVSDADSGLGGMGFILTGVEALGIPLSLVSVLSIILVFFTLKGVFKFLESYYNVHTQQYFIKKIRYENVDLLSNFSFKSFVKSDAGEIQNTLGGEVGRVSNAYRGYFLSIQAGILVLVYFVLAFVTNPQFALLVAVGGGCSNFVYKKIFEKTKETSKKISKGGHGFQGLLIQKVSFFKYLKATGFIKNFGLKLKHSIDYIEEANRKIGLYNSILLSTREPLVMFVVVVVILIQVSYFGENLSVLILSLLFFYRALNALVEVQNHWNYFLNMSGALDNMNKFMKNLKNNEEVTGSISVNQIKENISLRNVSFSYNTEKVLNNINLDIIVNKTYAFVGESGSGKSTIVNLIAGLLPADIGEVYLGENSYKNLNIESFQKRIGYITQEPVVYSDTIYNNVTHWAEKSKRNIEKFWYALEKAALADFIKSLPMQENELLGNNGIMVSGGQKQRISIARELFKDIDVLIMDEATSALDTETERSIQDNIEALTGKFTILIVAHRLSTIRSADKVVVLNKGSIDAIGSFDYLLQSSLKFKQMVNFQEV
ncbi:ABC transporter ATP-binding protein [Litoribacter populi]|uniref:ABC transporter ATP-binding protein n=1 Tax=Litoribacter populi TaxID=2598460 RepID=UPI001C8F9D5A|nr:ABC transporter ATP-binding protein [Litoribacter populi]